MMTREEAKDYINQVGQDLGFIDVNLVVNHLFDDFELRLVYLKHVEAEVELLSAKHIKLEQHINSLESQLTNTEQLTCGSCEYKYIVSYDCTECRHNDSPIDYLDLECFPDFGCRFHKLKDTQ